MAAGELHDGLLGRLQKRRRKGDGASGVPVEDALYVSNERRCGVVIRRRGVQTHCDDDGPWRPSSRRGQRQQSIACKKLAVPDREAKSQFDTYYLNLRVMADSLGRQPFRSSSRLPIVNEDGIERRVLLAIRCNGGS
nr:hypothetical protein [Synechococcus sp. CS-1328]